jgi:serine/threonine protein kinase
MTVDATRQKLLEMIEAQGELGGRFLNVRRIGDSGGTGRFSIVCQAIDKSNGNAPVALKFLNPFEPDDYRRKCFQREPEILALAQGQKDMLQIVAPRDEFSCTLQPHGFVIRFSYYAVELANGDLGSLIESASVPPRVMFLNFRAMCRAVQRLHSLGIVHRDIKPGNFLTMLDGGIKISDFGTARLIGPGVDGVLKDYAGFPPGELGYTAPEIFASLHDEDPRMCVAADVFSLGSCLFEMFSGVPLGIQLFDLRFQEDLLHTMAQVRRGERRRIYDQFVGSIANSIHLPSIAAFAPTVPSCIVPIVDELYRSMASLDYRRRVRDFGSVFLKINRGILVLDYEAKIRTWRQRRERERQAATERHQKRLVGFAGNRREA